MVSVGWIHFFGVIAIITLMTVFFILCLCLSSYSFLFLVVVDAIHFTLEDGSLY